MSDTVQASPLAAPASESFLKGAFVNIWGVMAIPVQDLSGEHSLGMALTRTTLTSVAFLFHHCFAGTTIRTWRSGTLAAPWAGRVSWLLLQLFKGLFSCL